jgi:hypothetical protein
VKALPKIRSGTGRGTALAVEGPVEGDLYLSEMNPAQPGPSVASRHLPVPGRILGAKPSPFFRGFAACFGLVFAVPSALAQSDDDSYSGGSRLRPQAAQLVQSGPAYARSILLKFGQCIYSRRTGVAERFLALPVDSQEYSSLHKSLFVTLADSCLEGDGELYFTDDLLRGALFEAAYRKKFGKKGPTNFASSLKTGQLETYVQPLSDDARRQLVLQDMAECVVRADPKAVKLLILSSPESARENEAVRTVTAKISPCLSNGQKAGFSRPSLRAILAEALYRLSVTATAPVKAI